MDGLFLGLLLPFAGTVTGAACVFLLRDSLPGMLQKALLGFASGVMVAASVWSLLIPSIELSGAEGAWAVMPATVGFLAGMGFLLLLDHITPHLHLDSKKPEGPRSRLSRTSMLTLAVTLHNLPEGMAVGAVMAGVLTQSADLSAAFCLLLSTVWGVPVSTTHTKTSAIMGVGAVKRISAINFSVVRDMVLTWVFTFPGCGLISFAVAKIFISVWGF